MLNYILSLIPPSFGNTENNSVLLKKLTILGKVLGDFESTLEQCFNEIFAETSSSELTSWEILLNLPIAEGSPDSQRQSRILGKLRGTGTCTPELLKSIAEVYSNGECRIIENPPQYNFTVKFIGTLGIPPNLDDLQKTIEEIKPAHLAAEYAFSYLLIREVEGLTLNQLETMQLNKFAGGDI